MSALGGWDWPIHTLVYKTDAWGEPAVGHRDLSSVFCGPQMGSESEKEWVYVYV